MHISKNLLIDQGDLPMLVTVELAALTEFTEKTKELSMLHEVRLHAGCGAML